MFKITKQKQFNSTTEIPAKQTQKVKFTGYEKFVIAILATVQFSVILDFMVLSPLGYLLIPELNISTSQFGLVVSAYAFSAGISGLLAAGFADKFDRKKLLLFFYSGFIVGTLLCALAPTYHFLMGARIVTGIFGGVIGSVSLAIVADLFKMEMRGRVMGFVQMAFASSQVLGIPIGLWMAQHLGWHSPFWMIASFSLFVSTLILIYLKPVNAHLNHASNRHPFMHLWKTISKSNYLKGFIATTLLATGGFMMQPFGTVFSTHNLMIPEDSLKYVFGITGIFTFIFGPILGRLSDQIGKYNIFIMGTVISSIIVLTYTNLGPTPIWLVILLNVILFVGISSRMIASSALLTAVPAPQDRGAFMSINSSVQQIAGGMASVLAGMIVVQQPDGSLLHYPVLGYVVAVSMLITLFLMFNLNKQIKQNNQSTHGKG